MPNIRTTSHSRAFNKIDWNNWEDSSPILELLETLSSECTSFDQFGYTDWMSQDRAIRIMSLVNCENIAAISMLELLNDQKIKELCSNYEKSNIHAKKSKLMEILTNRLLQLVAVRMVDITMIECTMNGVEGNLLTHLFKTEQQTVGNAITMLQNQVDKKYEGINNLVINGTVDKILAQLTVKDIHEELKNLVPSIQNRGANRDYFAAMFKKKIANIISDVANPSNKIIHRYPFLRLSTSYLKHLSTLSSGPQMLRNMKINVEPEPIMALEDLRHTINGWKNQSVEFPLYNTLMALPAKCRTKRMLGALTKQILKVLRSKNAILREVRGDTYFLELQGYDAFSQQCAALQRDLIEKLNLDIRIMPEKLRIMDQDGAEITYNILPLARHVTTQSTRPPAEIFKFKMTENGLQSQNNTVTPYETLLLVLEKLSANSMLDQRVYFEKMFSEQTSGGKIQNLEINELKAQMNNISQQIGICSTTINGEPCLQLESKPGSAICRMCETLNDVQVQELVVEGNYTLQVGEKYLHMQTLVNPEVQWTIRHQNRQQPDVVQDFIRTYDMEIQKLNKVWRVLQGKADQLHRRDSNLLEQMQVINQI